MNYKVAIDPGHGGSDSGFLGNGLIESEFSLLVSNYLKQRFDSFGIPNIITSSFGNDKNVIVLSNHLNKGRESGFEIVYPLRSTDKLAEKISKSLESSGVYVNKYYQLRDSSNTRVDSYPIIRNTPDYETVVLLYGYVDDLADSSRIKSDYLNYAEAIVKAVSEYIGVKYVPVSDNYYVVVKGDSLWKIANKFGVTVDSLKKANNLTTNLLNIGDVLFIPADSSSNNDFSYVVKPGDTLYKIANLYKISVNELKAINNLSSNVINIGQVLKIPNSRTYVVKKGDSLWSISRAYGISVDSLKSANGLDSNLLNIGQVLIIP